MTDGADTRSIDDLSELWIGRYEPHRLAQVVHTIDLALVGPVARRHERMIRAYVCEFVAGHRATGIDMIRRCNDIAVSRELLGDEDGLQRASGEAVRIEHQRYLSTRVVRRRFVRDA